MHIFLALILFQSCYLIDNYIIGTFLISQDNSTERILNRNYGKSSLVEIYIKNKTHKKIKFSSFKLTPAAKSCPPHLTKNSLQESKISYIKNPSKDLADPTKTSSCSLMALVQFVRCFQ